MVATLIHVEARAHEHELLGERGNLRVEAERQSDGRERTPDVQRHLVRVLPDLLDHEERAVQIDRLQRRHARRRCRHFIGRVVTPGIPRAFVRELAELRLPCSGQVARVDQRERGALCHRNLAVASQLQHAQHVRGAGFDPGVAGRDRDTEHLDVGRLQHRERRNHVGPERRAILVDEHFLLRRLAGGRRRPADDHRGDKRRHQGGA